MGLPTAPSHDHRGDAALVTKIEEAFRAEPGLERAEVRFQTKFKVLGISVDGDKGTAAAPTERRQLLVAALAATIKDGHADRKSLERLVGSAIPTLQVRREISCVLGVTYAEILKMKYGQRYRLSGELADELCPIVMKSSF